MPPRDLGGIFDEDPELYDRARPGYPSELFNDLVELATLMAGARVTEVGAGTGQATAALLARGLHVTAVEPGAGLSGVLRRKFATEPLDVVVTAFENWDPPAAAFDALVAFTAWHWLSPTIRTPKSAVALRPGGGLATVTTTHIAGGSEAFFAEVQQCYECWNPATPPGLRLPVADAVPPVADEVDDSSLFSPAMHRRYQQDVTYSTRDYLDMLATYSGHRALPAVQRHGLFACIGELIERRFDGWVTKRYLYELRLARRHPL